MMLILLGSIQKHLDIDVVCIFCSRAVVEIFAVRNSLYNTLIVFNIILCIYLVLIYRDSYPLGSTKYNLFIWAAVNGDIPVTAIFTSASVHDSSVALPLIKETSGKLDYLYDLFFYRVFCLIFGWWGLLGGY